MALGVLALGFAWLAWAGRRLEARGGGAAKAVLLVAALMRLPLVALPPTLSDDVLRYVWDGRVAAAGFNPYRLAPDAAELTPLRDGLWRRLPHREVPTVYPPLALAAFSIAARLPAPVVVWKALVAAVDLALVAMLLALARRRGTPPARAVWYAWNPLVALEGAGMGHVDVLGAAAVVAVALLLTAREGRAAAASSGRAVRAALAAAGGALVKLAPLAALPMWARQSRRPWRFAAVALGVSAAALAPVAAACGGVPPGLTAYAVSWEFNGPLYEPLWRGLDGAGVAPALHRALDRAKQRSGNYELGNSLYPYLYPQLLAKLLLAAGMAWAFVRSLGARDPLAGAGWLFGGLLLCSATVYPWYLLWVLPWAALERRPAWLALSALLPLSYLPHAAGVSLWPWVYLAIWGPFFALLGAETVARAIERRSTARGAPA